MLAAVNIKILVSARSAASCRANLVTVGSGQVPVQHHDVVAGDGQMAERIAAVQDDVHGHALPAQPRSDRPGQNPVIFHDQHSHASNDAS